MRSSSTAIAHQYCERNAFVTHPTRRFDIPLLRRKKPADALTAESELVVSFRHRTGKVLDEFGWPYETSGLYDRPSRATGRLSGRVRTFAQGVRVLRVPAPPHAACLTLSRAEIIDGQKPGQFTFRETPLAIYVLDEHESSRPIGDWTTPYGSVQSLRARRIPLALQPSPNPAPSDGNVVDGFVGPNEPKVPITEAFNIVVLGDGFTQDERQVFLDWADTLIYGRPGVDGLKRIQPFKKLWRKHINVR